MRTFLSILLTVSAAFAGASAWAQVVDSSTLSTPMPDIIPQKKFEQSDRITDNRLKAENGSLNRYSMKLNLTYRGPVINDVGVRDQPNPDGSVGSYATAISAKLAARYRFTSLTTLNFGTGIKVLHPTDGMDGMEVNNPYVAYDRATTLGPFELRTTPSLIAVTFPSYLKVGQYGTFAWDNAAVYAVPGTRISLSMDAGASLNFFKRGYIKKDKNSTSYAFEGGPSIAYQITDKVAVRTSVLYGWWNLRKKRQWFLDEATPVQRAGVGWAFRKDIYFSPYLEFFPNRLGLNSTTINMSTVFSL